MHNFPYVLLTVQGCVRLVTRSRKQNAELWFGADTWEARRENSSAQKVAGISGWSLFRPSFKIQPNNRVISFLGWWNWRTAILGIKLTKNPIGWNSRNHSMNNSHGAISLFGFVSPFQINWWITNWVGLLTWFSNVCTVYAFINTTVVLQVRNLKIGHWFHRALLAHKHKNSCSNNILIYFPHSGHQSMKDFFVLI